jgi:hypothetical protein
MSEPAKEKSKEEQHRQIVQQIHQCAHDAGMAQYNIERAKETIESAHTKIRNLTSDANKLFEKIQKEKAEAAMVKAQGGEEPAKLELVESANA